VRYAPSCKLDCDISPQVTLQRDMPLFPLLNRLSKCFSRCLSYSGESLPSHRTRPENKTREDVDDHWAPALSSFTAGSSASRFENSSVTSPSSNPTILTDSKSLTIQSGPAAFTCSAV
jgi:hypothetical protein